MSQAENSLIEDSSVVTSLAESCLVVKSSTRNFALVWSVELVLEILAESCSLARNLGGNCLAVKRYLD
jgi:hypothetical protein